MRESAFGDTLQAVRRAQLSPIRWPMPGEVDLTAHVDFQALGDAAESIGAQRAWARRRKASSCAASASRARARALKATATPEKAADIDAALARLTAAARPDGRAVQGDGDLPIRALGALPGFDSYDAVAPFRRASIHASSIASPGIRHALLHARGRRVGGHLCELNGGIGSDDAPDECARRTAPAWRPRSASRPTRLLTAYQIHSPDVVVAEQPWTRETRAARRRHRDARRRASRSASSPPTAGRCCSPTREARRHRRRACRLARRAHRRARSDDCGDGKARRRRARASPRRSGR